MTWAVVIDELARKKDSEAAVLEDFNKASRSMVPPPPPAEFKTPNQKDRQDAAATERHTARLEARAKAQAMPDRDLGLSPPDYIENLKDKLRRKPSVNEEENSVPALPPRTRSFSEPHQETDDKLHALTSPSDPPARQVNSQAYSAGAVAAVVARTAPSVAAPPPAVLKTAKSVPQMLPPPRSDVIGHLFLHQQQQQTTTSPSSSLSPTSPPLSPQSSSSSKSASYLWAGLSPAESQLKLDEAATTPFSSSTSPPTVCILNNFFFIRFYGFVSMQRSVPPKKSKDRERRRSLIQAFTDLFKKEEPAKEPEAAAPATAAAAAANGNSKKASKETKTSPSSKFQLFKLSPRKEKSKVGIVHFTFIGILVKNIRFLIAGTIER